MIRRISVILTAFMAVFVLSGTAQANHAKWDCGQHWWKGSWHVKEQIKCFAGKYDVSVSTSIRVADCESGFTPSATNNRFAGIFQIGDTEWESWYTPWVRWRDWPDKASRLNGRLNVAVATYHVKHAGWEAWTCY